MKICDLFTNGGVKLVAVSIDVRAPWAALLSVRACDLPGGTFDGVITLNADTESRILGGDAFMGDKHAWR